MGLFSLICVGLVGAYVFAATYAAILWARDRRARLPLVVAAHALSSAAISVSLLVISRSSSAPAMQVAVSARLVAILAMLACMSALVATVAERRTSGWLLPTLACAALVLTVGHGAGPFATGVVGVEQVSAFGEPVWAPAPRGGWPAAALLLPLLWAHAYALHSAVGVWHRDRFAAAVLAGTALATIAVTPLQWLAPPGRVAVQVMTLGFQLGPVLLGVVLLAREHERRARQSLAAQRLYRGMFEQTYQYVAILDLDGCVMDCNRTSLEVIGARLEDVQGLPFADTPWWRRSPDRDRLDAAIRAAAAGEPQRFEAIAMASGGEIRIDFAIRPLRDESGAVIRLVPEARDITEEHAAQEAHRKADLQLQQSQKLEAVGQLAGGIAHDFNNLLTVIHGFAGLLAATPEARSSGTEVEQIRGASERAMSLTRQLLTFSRHAVTDAQVIDLNALVRRAEPLLSRQLGADVVLAVSAGADVPHVKADPAQVERALINLVANARDAMPHGGRVAITTGRLDAASAPEPLRALDTAAVLTVSDTGAGMSAEVLARLFEPFFTTKGPGRGTGLGLAVVDRVVKQAGGLVHVASREGEGTTVTLAWPTTADDVPEAAEAPAISGSPADDLVPRGVATGGAHVVQKPATPDILAARVRALLDDPVPDAQ